MAVLFLELTRNDLFKHICSTEAVETQLVVNPQTSSVFDLKHSGDIMWVML